MTKGFSCLAVSLDNLTLDIPLPITVFQQLVPKELSEGWLDLSFKFSDANKGSISVIFPSLSSMGQQYQKVQKD